jgi:hypothetical protein
VDAQPEADESLIAKLIEDLSPGAFVTKFIVVAEIIETDGERAVCVTASDDLRRWDTYGLLTEALMTEKSQHIASRLEES